MLSTQKTTSVISKGNLAKYGVTLEIDKEVSIDYNKPLCFDVETTGIGRDVFVGVGFTQDGETVHYHTSLDLFKSLDWAKIRVIGHNIKFDLHQLDQWWINIDGFDIASDSMIMSYVYETTAKTHSLKPLSQLYLGLTWPTYAEMTTYFDERISFKKFDITVGEDGKKHRKKLAEPLKLIKLIKKSKTLAEVPVEEVAEYCGMDVLASWRLSKKMYSLMNINQRRIYNTLELPTLKILFTMERLGIQVDLDQLKVLHARYKERLELLDTELKDMTGLPELNPGSGKQLIPILEGLGLACPLTRKKNKSVAKGFLLKHRDKPFVQTLLDYRAVHKLFSTYLDGFIKLPSMPRVHSTFNQVRYDAGEDEWEGMSTNRLSSSDPNMQNIPKRGEDAKLIRKLFIPKDGHSLIVGDYGQVEYRILAHESQDRTLLEAFNAGKDLHDEVGKALNCSREAAKQINYATVYGATAPKVADLAKISLLEAESLLKKHEERFPKVYYWKNRELSKARKNSGIFTMLGRFIPIPGINSMNKWDRMRSERQAINYIIQGSAAEVIKLAMISCVKNGYDPILQVHDELIFEVEEDKAEKYLPIIKELMETVVKLDVPLNVDIRIGNSWAEAKA